MLWKAILALPFVLIANCTYAEEPPIRYATRGELLYLVYCINCHGTQPEWRDNRLAKDWVGLKKQVRLWQANLELGWSKEDIEDVARFLNLSYYQYSWSE